jgi:hypothetical protein
VDGEGAELALLDGDRCVMSRERREVRLLTTISQDDGWLVHPFLTAVGVTFAWWDGRHAFHGGAFVDSECRAWCVLGERESGKSSTLARLSNAGLPVIADDLVVIDGGHVLAGPRCIDLRLEPAKALALETAATPVRGNERLRLPLPGVAAEVPLHAWVFLVWGDSFALRRLGAAEWLARLTMHRTTLTEGAPNLLELAGLQAWELQRPRTWWSLEPAVERLLDLAGA